MKHAELAGLDEEQVVLLLHARSAFTRDGIPVRDTLEQSDAPAAVKAVVADRFCPGAGDGYR